MNTPPQQAELDAAVRRLHKMQEQLAALKEVEENNKVGYAVTDTVRHSGGLANCKCPSSKADYGRILRQRISAATVAALHKCGNKKKAKR